MFMESVPSHPPSSRSELGQHLLPSMKTSSYGKSFTQSDAAGGVEWQFRELWLPPPPYQESDPKILLSNLVFLEQKVHQLQGVARSIISENANSTVPFRWSGEDAGRLLMRQQIVVADTASIITQVISTAGRLLQGRTEISLPGVAQLIDLVGQQNLQVAAGIGSYAAVGAGTGAGEGSGASWRESDSLELQSLEMNGDVGSGQDQDESKTTLIEAEDCGNWVEKQVCSVQGTESGSATGDLDLRRIAKDGEEEEKVDSPGCYEVLEIDKEEILAPHTHFCVICGKGFKRDANLRMHMRGHGDMYKTMEALANPNKGMKMADLVRFRRYSCPFEGCKRNRNHKKFQPLKTILCVKNHYKRSHCDKSYVCRRCNRKKFSVIADLKTHEKHCGEDKWQCSCGTTFSRKDKLFGHVALFQGHSPVLPTNYFKGSGVPNVVLEGKNNGSRTGSRAPTPNCGPSHASSVELSIAEGYKRVEPVKNQQTFLAETNLSREENNCNFTINDIESADELLPSSPTLSGSPFSFHVLLCNDFTEANGDLNFSDA